MQYAVLPSRGLLLLSGEDCHAFLQGIVTNDVTPLKDNHAVYAALLSPQGKFLHDFFLVPHGEKILVDCEKARLDDLRKRLTLYKLRSKVAIESAPENMGVVAAWGVGSPAKGFPDPRLPQLGCRMVGDVTENSAWCMGQGWQHVDEPAYDRMRLELGVPDGSRDLEIDRAIILHYGFEDLHGVDFKKGCYVGQEVIARTKYRGAVRKFLHVLRAESALPAPGTPVTLNGASSGELHSVSGNGGLAILRIEDVEKSRATGASFEAAGVKLSVSLPAWASALPLSAAGE